MLSRRLLLAVPATLALLAPTAGPAAAHPTHEDAAAAATAVAWQRIAVRTVFTEGASPPQVGVLYLAFASQAVDDAARAVSRHRHASAPAAVATAAHAVLREYFPSSSAGLDADLAATLASVPDGRAQTWGVHIGRATAARVVASRTGDGRDDPTIVYQKPAAPGTWQPAPGGTMATAWLGFVDPLLPVPPVALDGPDALTSPAYATDYREVAALGSVGSTDRSPDQTATARFFAFNPQVMYRLALAELLEDQPLGLRETTRLYVAIDVAVSQAMIQTFRLKYDVGFWRPFEAIAGADSDGNPGTEAQTGWVPLVANPAYSDYTSGHAAATAPFAEVLRRTLGEDVPLRLVNPVLGVERNYGDLTSLERDALDSRVWGGLHFRDAMDDGYRLGHVTARRVLSALSRPGHHGHGGHHPKG